MGFDELLFFGRAEAVIAGKLLMAALVGALVGYERELHGRPAGLRTHLLVALGACLMTIVSEAFFIKYQGFDVDSVLRLDPARVAAQIVTGIGFIYSFKKRGGWSGGLNNQYSQIILEKRSSKGLYGIVLA